MLNFVRMNVAYLNLSMYLLGDLYFFPTLLLYNILHIQFLLGRNFFFALAFLIVTTSFGLLEIDLIKFSP